MLTAYHISIEGKIQGSTTDLYNNARYHYKKHHFYLLEAKPMLQLKMLLDVFRIETHLVGYINNKFQDKSMSIATYVFHIQQRYFYATRYVLCT